MMKGVCLRVLWLLLCLCASCQSLSLNGGRTGSSRSSALETLPGRWKRQDSAGDASKPSGEGPAAQEDDPGSGLTRVTFTQSRQYAANCCHSVPGLCSSAGKCVLQTTDCVSFCICVRSPDLPWCGGELRRLYNALRQRGQTGGASDGGDATGGAEAGDSDASAGSFTGSDHLLPATTGSLFPRAGLSLNGTASGSLGSSGVAGDEASPTEDHVLSPAQLASSLTAAMGEGALSGHDNVTGHSQSAGATGRHGPALVAMMNGEEEEPDRRTSAAESDAPREDINPSSNNRTTNILLKDIIHNKDTEPNTHLLHSSNKTQQHNTTTTMGDTTARPATNGGGQFLLSWWPPENGTGCEIECELTGGICAVDVNWTYVCVPNNESCRMMGCEHGTCLPSTNPSVHCECEPGWSGIFCHKECALDCGEHGHCAIFQDDVICSCDANYTGVACEELKPPPPPWTEGVTQDGVTTGWQIAVGCLGVTALLLLLLLLSAYVLWRRQWLPMRKLVHYFQHYEEDDGKEYDAFVSYRSRSRDEMFVLHELYPYLERHLDFKLCMHFRDFPPGETIADNIIQAIENSRRTILVLSPAYVQSEWCRLEYQKAQHEMLKLRHKIIPIMIEDVSGLTPADRNLQTILDTVTYIQWPGNEDSKRLDKFWKLLHLSMPKKKSGDFTRSLSSAESCGSDRPLTAVSMSCFSHVMGSMTAGESGVVLQPQRSLSITSSLEEAAEEGEAAHNSAAGTCCADSDHSSDSGCLRDRIPSSSSSSGESPPPPDPPMVTDSPVGTPLQDEVTHVTSDDHIVEIREFPGNQVKVTPWVPARMSTPC